HEFFRLVQAAMSKQRQSRRGEQAKDTHRNWAIFELPGTKLINDARPRAQQINCNHEQVQAQACDLGPEFLRPDEKDAIQDDEEHEAHSEVNLNRASRSTPSLQQVRIQGPSDQPGPGTVRGVRDSGWPPVGKDSSRRIPPNEIPPR